MLSAISTPRYAILGDIGLLTDSVTYDNMCRVRTGHFSGSGVSTNPTEEVTMMYHGLGSVIGGVGVRTVSDPASLYRAGRCA
jgi:hypothetical protein